MSKYKAVGTAFAVALVLAPALALAHPVGTSHSRIVTARTVSPTAHLHEIKAHIHAVTSHRAK